MTQKIRQRKSRPLRIESLEQRRLLAVAAYQAEFYSDDDGQIGELIEDDTIVAGDRFFLRITAQEFDPFLFGLRSAAVSVNWDSALVSAVEEDFQLDTVITDDLPLFRGGKLNNATGTIRNLSGTVMLSSGIGRAIGNARPETLAVVHMQAGSQLGEASFKLSFSEAQTIAVPVNELKPVQLRFDEETLTIVPAMAPVIDDVGSDAVDVVDEQFDEPIDEQTEEQVDEQTAEIMADSQPVTAPNALVKPADSESHSDEELPISESSSDEDATVAVDPPTFDLNQDGVFDFGDFGLLNLRQSPTVAENVVMDSSDVETNSAPMVVVPLKQNAAKEADSHAEAFCTFAPRGDAVAFESWLDALATAWLADTNARELRRRTQLSS